MRIGNDSGVMRPEAPTRSDRIVLAVVSGPIGQLLGTLLELAAVAAQAASARLRGARRRR
jgi:hypothetical protein